MRKWRSFDVPADDEWAVHHQIVVPKSYRHEILSIAHESPNVRSSRYKQDLSQIY